MRRVLFITDSFHQVWRYDYGSHGIDGGSWDYVGDLQEGRAFATLVMHNSPT